MGVWRGVGDEVCTSVVRTMAVSSRGHRVGVVAAGPIEWLVCFPEVVYATRHSPSVAASIGVSPIAWNTRLSPIVVFNPYLYPFSLSPIALSPDSRRESSIKMEASRLFETLPFHEWDFNSNYNCLRVCSRSAPPPIFVDADGHLWVMYDDGSCWSNFAWNVVIHGMYDAFGKIAMHHVSGGVADVRDAFSHL